MPLDPIIAPCNTTPSMTTPAQFGERTDYERHWLKTWTKHIAIWDCLGEIRHCSCHIKKKFIAWHRNIRGEVRINRVYMVTGFVIDPDGPRMELTDNFGKVTKVGARPIELEAYKAYVWLPAFLDARWAPNRSVWEKPDIPKYRELNWRLCTRILGDHTNPDPGQVQISTQKEFQTLFPEAQF